MSGNKRQSESPPTLEKGKRRCVSSLKEGDGGGPTSNLIDLDNMSRENRTLMTREKGVGGPKLKFLLEAIEECDDGALRFTEMKYQNVSLLESEDSDTECALEEVKEDENLETSKGDIGSPEDQQDSELLEDPGTESRDGFTKGSRFDDLCPDPCDDSQWFSLLKDIEVDALSIEDFDNILFKSVEEAQKFYSYYAFMVGFSVRKWRCDTRIYDGVEVICRRSWTCSKEGFCLSKKKPKENIVPDAEDNIVTGDEGTDPGGKGKLGPKLVKGKKMKKRVARGHKLTRLGCKATMSILLIKETGMYKVKKLITQHNHALAAPCEKHFLRSFRKVTFQDILEVEALRSANVGPGGAFDYFVHQNGGPAFVGFTVKDLYNALGQQKRKNEDGDAEAAINWLQIKGREEERFYARYVREKGGRLAGLFWRDTQSLVDYELYGDVVAIDSTYKTNVYGMPLVLFVGANNHRASVVFACALVVNEREPLFNWVIMKFLEAMNNLKPKSVVTDGDDRLRKVLERHMPETKHRLCAWHIGRNVGQNVKEHKLAKALGKMIYASYSITEWEDEWKSLIKEHKVENNTWIISLYNKRKKWAEAYCRGQWYGGMCTTQRCEGMNSKFKVRIGKYTTLTSFIPMFQRGLDRLRDRVLMDNFKSKNHTRKYDSHMVAIEDFIFKTFTDDIFLVIRGQMNFEKNFTLASRVPDWDSNNLMFYVKQYDKPSRCWAVQYIARSSEKDDDESYSCSCLLFESEGIPCAHIFCVFKNEGVTVYPKSLICERWKKFHGNIAGDTVCSEDKDVGFKPSRFLALLGVARRVCSNLSDSPEGFEHGLSSLLKMEEKSLQYKVTKKPKVTHRDNANVIRDPFVPRTRFMQQKTETGDPIKGSEPHKCGICRQPGHNKARCPLNDTRGKDKSGKSLSQRSYGRENDMSSRGEGDGRTDTGTRYDDAFLPDLNSQVSESGEPVS